MSKTSERINASIAAALERQEAKAAERKARYGGGRRQTEQKREDVYYVADYGPLGRIRRCLFYTGLTALGMGVFILNALRDVESNTAKYVGVAQGLTLALFLWMLACLVNQWFAPPRLTARERDSLDRMKGSGAVTAAGCVITAVCTLLYALLNGGRWGEALLGTLLCLVSALPPAALYRLASTVTYTEEDGDE